MIRYRMETRDQVTGRTNQLSGCTDEELAMRWAWMVLKQSLQDPGQQSVTEIRMIRERVY